MIKEEKVSKCPTCGYIYCPECADEVENEEGKNDCEFCEAVIRFTLPFLEE